MRFAVNKKPHTCKTRDSLKSTLGLSKKDSYNSYFSVISILETMERKNQIELYAGDCRIYNALTIVEEEQHYTVCHYFKCKNVKHIIL